MNDGCYSEVKKKQLKRIRKNNILKKYNVNR